VTGTFPEILYTMILNCQKEGMEDIIGFCPHGRAFAVHQPRRFEMELMPRYFFNMGKIASFQRQLNLYGFKRINEGPDTGGYWHRKFLRGRKDLVVQLKRKSTSKAKRAIQEKEEMEEELLENIDPSDFYKLQPVGTGFACSSPGGSQQSGNAVDANQQHSKYNNAGVPSSADTILQAHNILEMRERLDRQKASVTHALLCSQLKAAQVQAQQQQLQLQNVLNSNPLPVPVSASNVHHAQSTDVTSRDIKAALDEIQQLKQQRQLQAAQMQQQILELEEQRRFISQMRQMQQRAMSLSQTQQSLMHPCHSNIDIGVSSAASQQSRRLLQQQRLEQAAAASAFSLTDKQWKK